MFFDVDASFNGIDISDAVEIDAAAMVRVGGGLDYKIYSDWNLVIDASYFRTIVDTDARIVGFGFTPLEFDGLLVTAGLQYRF